MKMLARTYTRATSTHVDICIIDIIPSCCQTNITQITRQLTRALNRSAVAPVTEPQAVWLCVTHRPFLPYGSYETVKVDYVNLRLYLSERMCSSIPLIKNHIIALCSKLKAKQHEKRSSQFQGDFLTGMVIDYITNSLTGDVIEEERTSKQMQIRSMMSPARRQTLTLDTFEIRKDAKQLQSLQKRLLKSEQKPAKNKNLNRKNGYLPTGRRQPTATILLQKTLQLLGFLIPGLNLVGSYLSQPNQLDQSNQTILTSSRSLLVTWKLKSQPSHLGQINHPQVNKHRPYSRKIRILAILVRTNSNTQDIEPSSLARINYNIDDDQ